MRVHVRAHVNMTRMCTGLVDAQELEAAVTAAVVDVEAAAAKRYEELLTIEKEKLEAHFDATLTQTLAETEAAANERHRAALAAVKQEASVGQVGWRGVPAPIDGCCLVSRFIPELRVQRPPPSAPVLQVAAVHEAVKASEARQRAAAERANERAIEEAVRTAYAQHGAQWLVPPLASSWSAG